MYSKMNYGAYTVITLLLLVFFGSFTAPAIAEGGDHNLGNGVYGANRRVRSKDGFVGIETVFIPPTGFYVPAAYDANGEYVSSNLQQSKPSFYIGLGTGSHGQEIDAGMQWEYATSGTISQGWSAFISWDHAPDTNKDGKADKFTNPLLSGQPWRTTDLGLFVDLICQATATGGVQLSVGTNTENFSFFWDISGHNAGESEFKIFETNQDGGITHAAVNAMSVKRVVAITQKAAPYCDGSYMENVGASTLILASPTFDENYKLVPQWTTTGWPLEDVSSDKTKYTAGEDEEDPPNWIVDFDFEGINKPENSGPNYSDGTYRDVPVQARYNNETVSISLRTQPAHIAGIRVNNSTG